MKTKTKKTAKTGSSSSRAGTYVYDEALGKVIQLSGVHKIMRFYRSSHEAVRDMKGGLH